MLRLNNPLINLLLVGIVYGIYLIFLLSKLEYNPAYLISLGERFADLNQIPKNIVVWKNYGYDGQFYYRLALNPFTFKKEEFGITIDIPSYRHQRIIYPLITYLLSFGNKDFVPTVLLFVNFIALLLIGFFGGYFAKCLKLHSLWGLAFVIYPTFPYSLSRDLTEIVEVCFLLVTLILIKKAKFLSAAIILTLVILSRETALVLAISLLLTFKSRYFFIPFLSFIIWQIVLFLNWGVVPIPITNLSLIHPFSGISSFLQQAITSHNRLGFIELMFLLIFVISVFITLKSSKSEAFQKVAFCIYFLMGLFYAPFIWVADIAFFRALTEFYIMGTTILLSSKSNIKPFIFLLAALIWFFSLKQFAYFF